MEATSMPQSSADDQARHGMPQVPPLPDTRPRYLAEIADCVRGYKRRARADAALAREIQQLRASAAMLVIARPDRARAAEAVHSLADERANRLSAEAKALLEDGPLSAQVALPTGADQGQLLEWLTLGYVPGRFPYTAGAFTFEPEVRDPPRVGAGEGDACRANLRLKLLSAGLPAKRLVPVFDSVTLGGRDPDARPDLYGKIGNGGVSVATLDDMKLLFRGFDLTDPATSVGLTIDGPAPTILAMFLHTALDQKLDAHRAANGREPDVDEAAAVRAWVLQNVRGAVQADRPKEDPGRDARIFSTEFALALRCDIAEYFVAHRVRDFQSVCISGCHLAEAGADPVSEVARALASGFTFVEAGLARGMAIDDFAPQLGFFFSNGMDPEYSVLGRVARRIWAVAMRDRYGARECNQKLKHEVQAAGPQPSGHWGGFAIDELTERVEERVLEKFERMSESGGLPCAMATAEQPGNTGDDGSREKTPNDTGEGPPVGHPHAEPPEPVRSTDGTRHSPLDRLADFHSRHAGESPAMLQRLQHAAIAKGNVFDVLMDAVRCCSLGQITDALLEVGGEYRRSRRRS